MHLLLRRTQPCSRPSPTNTKLHACARLSFASHLYPDAALCPEPSPCPACFVACAHVLAALASLLAFSLRFPCLARHLSNLRLISVSILSITPSDSHEIYVSAKIYAHFRSNNRLSPNETTASNGRTSRCHPDS